MSTVRLPTAQSAMCNRVRSATRAAFGVFSLQYTILKNILSLYHTPQGIIVLSNGL
jgi:hypothetical protein